MKVRSDGERIKWVVCIRSSKDLNRLPPRFDRVQSGIIIQAAMTLGGVDRKYPRHM